MVKNFSYSQLNILTQCAQKYKLLYIDRIEVPIKGEVLRGDAYHKALAFAYSNIVIYKEKPSIDEVLDIYSDTWNKRLGDRIVIDEGEEIYTPSVDFRGKDPGKLKDDGIKLLKIYYNTVLPKVIPSEVEVRKTIVYEGIPIIAYMDLIDWSGIVIDHKVKAKMFSGEELAKELQSPFYGLVLGNDNIEFQFHAAIAVKNPHVEIIPVKRNKNDMDWIGKLVVSAWKQISAGLFTPSPGGWWCSPNDCPVWGICHLPSNF